MTRHITWETFTRDYIEPSVPAIYQLPGNPSVSIYVSENAKRIGVKIQVDSNTILPDIPLKELSLELRADKDGLYADLSTSNTVLYEHFYSMMCFISDSVQLDNKNTIDAIYESVERLKYLISSVVLLSNETIIGIWGELWVLEKLIESRGEEAVFLWKGPDKSIHDFRMEGIELEVKTTRNEDRIHIISRLTQLEPSPDFDLLLCSIQVVEGTTDGLSLSAYVEKIKKYLIKDQKASDYFTMQLEKEGYKTSQGKFYITRYYLRSAPELVAVTDELPRLNRGIIDEEYGKQLSSRINNVHYSIDVTGLGVIYSNPEFKEIFS